MSGGGFADVFLTRPFVTSNEEGLCSVLAVARVRLSTAPSLAIASREEVLAEPQDRLDPARSATFFKLEPLRIVFRLRNVTWN